MKTTDLVFAFCASFATLGLAQEVSGGGRLQPSWTNELPFCQSADQRAFGPKAKAMTDGMVWLEGDDAGADFGGGIILRHLSQRPVNCSAGRETPPHPNQYYRFQKRDYAEGEEATLLEINGYMRSKGKGKVRGQVTLRNAFSGTRSTSESVEETKPPQELQVPGSREAKSGSYAGYSLLVRQHRRRQQLGKQAVNLVLLYRDGGEWTEAARKSEKLSFQIVETWAVEAEIPDGAEVKLVLTARWGPLATEPDLKKENIDYLALHDARMVGAHCYLDSPNSKHCAEFK